MKKAAYIVLGIILFLELSITYHGEYFPDVWEFIGFTIGVGVYVALFYILPCVLFYKAGVNQGRGER